MILAIKTDKYDKELIIYFKEFNKRLSSTASSYFELGNKPFNNSKVINIKNKIFILKIDTFYQGLSPITYIFEKLIFRPYLFYFILKMQVRNKGIKANLKKLNNQEIILELIKNGKF